MGACFYSSRIQLELMQNQTSLVALHLLVGARVWKTETRQKLYKEEKEKGRKRERKAKRGRIFNYRERGLATLIFHRVKRCSWGKGHRPNFYPPEKQEKRREGLQRSKEQRRWQRSECRQSADCRSDPTNGARLTHRPIL